MSSLKAAAMLLAALSAAPVTGALAQKAKTDGAPPTAVRDPADPKASVPPVRYTSAFERYRANAPVDVGAWRQSNDAVGRIGGWRIYGREAIPDSAASEPPAAAGRTPETASAPKPASGHKH